MERLSGPKLTSDLDYWEVTLTGGDVVRLRAHAVKESAEGYVFSALMEGSPHYEYELARFPREVVQDWQGGWPTPRA
jgi:hypothetical protein